MEKASTKTTTYPQIRCCTTLRKAFNYTALHSY